MSWRLLLAVAIVACGWLLDADALAQQQAAGITRWTAARGDWTDPEHWTAGVPGTLSRAFLGGRGQVQLPAATSLAGVGVLKVGTESNDQASLHILGGRLVVRRDYLHIGEADGSQAEVELRSGALHGVSGVFLGGSGEETPAACRAALRISGGSFLCRYATVGWGQGAEAVFAVEGSQVEAVHILEYLALGVPVRQRQPSVSTLAFTLDEHGVTPISIQSPRTGLRISRVVDDNACQLQVKLNAVPPRDEVVLVAANVPTIGAFDDCPEGALVRASHNGREYRWTLTYRGGANGCCVALTNVQGHADDAPATKCRAMPAPPQPLWRQMPATPPEDTPPAALAFEGAEGFGRHSAGGRGGGTIRVQNLRDAGPGSFRAAVSASGPRIVEFDVAGQIELKSPIRIDEPYLTVNGQSAPEGGITFTGNGFIVQTHDVVLRHFRIRPGDDTDNIDALSFHDAQRCIADHLSVSWGTDEVLSVTGLSDAITIQWCIIAEGLNRQQHGFASLAGGWRATWHHNLFAHHVSRVPRFVGITWTDFRNNVLYNWGHTSGYGEFERLNYVGNYLKPGPSTTQSPPRIHRGEEFVGDGSLYLEDNILEGRDAVTADNWLGVGFDPAARSSDPFPAPAVQSDSAAAAFDRVLAEAGALPAARDAHDRRIVGEVRSGTGRIIDSTQDLRAPRD